MSATNPLARMLADSGLTLSEAARRVGVYPSTIYRDSRPGKRVSASMAVRYHAALGIPLEDMRPDLPWPKKEEQV